MKEKITLERAKEIAEKLKKKYKFGKASCPSWFKHVSLCMEQDGNYHIAICIPSWSSIGEDEFNKFLEPFDGIMIKIRVVRDRIKREQYEDTASRITKTQ